MPTKPEEPRRETLDHLVFVMALESSTQLIEEALSEGKPTNVYEWARLISVPQADLVLDSVTRSTRIVVPTIGYTNSDDAVFLSPLASEDGLGIDRFRNTDEFVGLSADEWQLVLDNAERFWEAADFELSFSIYRADMVRDPECEELVHHSLRYLSFWAETIVHTHAARLLAHGIGPADDVGNLVEKWTMRQLAVANLTNMMSTPSARTRRSWLILDDATNLLSGAAFYLSGANPIRIYEFAHAFGDHDVKTHRRDIALDNCDLGDPSVQRRARTQPAWCHRAAEGMLAVYCSLADRVSPPDADLDANARAFRVLNNLRQLNEAHGRTIGERVLPGRGLVK